MAIIWSETASRCSIHPSSWWYSYRPIVDQFHDVILYCSGVRRWTDRLLHAMLNPIKPLETEGTCCHICCHWKEVLLKYSRYLFRHHYLLRVNFTLEEMAPAIPAYTHFRACLQNRYMVSGEEVEVEAELVDLSQVPQCFDYYRVKELVCVKL